MSLINFKPGNAAVTITKLWTDFKAVVAEKSLLMQYEEDSNLYYIYTLDADILPELKHRGFPLKGF